MSGKNTIQGKPLEFGNIDQIKWLRKKEEILRKGIIEVDLDVEIISKVNLNFNYECPSCLHKNYEDLDCYDYNEREKIDFNVVNVNQNLS